jgi:hypothetical protein
MNKEVRQLNLLNNCIVIDRVKIFRSSFTLKKELPKILKEKGLI